MPDTPPRAAFMDRLRAAGVPVLGVIYDAIGTFSAVQYMPSATPAQQNQGNAIAADVTAKWGRIPRALQAIQDGSDGLPGLQSLTVAQQQQLWTQAQGHATDDFALRYAIKSAILPAQQLEVVARVIQLVPAFTALVPGDKPA